MGIVLMVGEQLLDTEKDSPAELIYPRLGYTKVSYLPHGFKMNGD
jgi:hypothetical protein